MTHGTLKVTWVIDDSFNFLNNCEPLKSISIILSYIVTSLYPTKQNKWHTKEAITRRYNFMQPCFINTNAGLQMFHLFSIWLFVYCIEYIEKTYIAYKCSTIGLGIFVHFDLNICKFADMIWSVTLCIFACFITTAIP